MKKLALLIIVLMLSMVACKKTEYITMCTWDVYQNGIKIDTISRCMFIDYRCESYSNDETVLYYKLIKDEQVKTIKCRF